MDEEGKGTEEQEKGGRRTAVADFEMNCPHCEGLCSVTVFRRTITAMVPAETELIPVVTAGGQGSLDLDVNPPEGGAEVETKAKGKRGGKKSKGK